MIHDATLLGTDLVRGKARIRSGSEHSSRKLVEVLFREQTETRLQIAVTHHLVVLAGHCAAVRAGSCNGTKRAIAVQVLDALC